MAIVVPFLCIRPCEGKAAEIAALPYDVYSKEEAKAEVAKHPDSFLAIDRADIFFSDDVPFSAPEVYEKAKELLENKIANGDFIREEVPAYFLYEMTMGDRVQTGVVACASIDDYKYNVIKKHENTRAEKEEDRVRHIEVCSAQTGPIFLAYKDRPSLRELIEKEKEKEPIYDFVADDGIGHRVFAIRDRYVIEAMQKEFQQMESLYIADGHHRAASAVRVGMKKREAASSFTGKEEFNYFLSVLFPDTELKIMDYNRVVMDLNGLTVPAFLEKIADVFNVGDPEEEPIKPTRKGEVSMYLDHRWYPLSFRPAQMVDDAVEGLDVSILQNYLLQPILGIQDPRRDERIDFVGGIRGLEELERRVNEGAAVAFAMYPTSMEELFAVADERRLMPPKSTWFEPKLRSGLFIHEIESE